MIHFRWRMKIRVFVQTVLGLYTACRTSIVSEDNYLEEVSFYVGVVIICVFVCVCVWE